VTPVKVVDASALAAFLFGEPEAEAIVPRLAGAPLIAPALIHFELANVCLIKCRRRPAQRDALLAGFRLRENLAIDIVDVDQPAVLALAEQTSLTAYDAAYLWLANHRAAELITLDKALLRATTR